MEKLTACLSAIRTINWQAVIVGGAALAILIIWPKFFGKIPASLIAVIVAIIMVKVIHMDVKTIGDLYTISSKLPGVTVPTVSFSMIVELLPDAFTIAVLAGIESLLSCVVSDGMIGGRHKPNMEMVAQGAGNIVSALFGGIPATGAIARTAANVKNWWTYTYCRNGTFCYAAVDLLVLMPMRHGFQCLPLRLFCYGSI